MFAQPRLAWSCLALFLAVSLGACGGKLAEKPTTPVSFAGRWILNESLSDDPQLLIEQQQRERMRERRVRERTRTDDIDDFREAAVESARAGADPMRKLISMFSLSARRLDIVQTARALVVSNGDTSTEYVFGQQSVVSMLSGAADRRVGWQSDALVVQTRSPDGPSALQIFKVSTDGRQLTLTTTLNAAGEGVLVKRVFDKPPASGAVPYK